MTEEEQKIKKLREAILEGINSGIDENFDPKKHLKMLQAKWRKKKFKNK